MATTPNFGLPLPADSTYVADMPEIVRDASTITDNVLKTQQTTVDAAAADADASRQAAQEAGALVGTPAGAAILAAVSGPGDVREKLEADFASFDVVNAAAKQAQLYGDFFLKVRNGGPVVAAALGDSTYYGYDEVSADRVPPPTEALPDGSHHTRYRSPYPFPERMQEHLREVYGLDNVTVVNRGYSGDTTQLAYNRWITPAGSNLTMVGFGINDANTAVGVDVYIEYYEKIILREINEYNSAVVILAPFKQNLVSPSRAIDAYRTAAVALANKYGIPFIDAEPWLAGYGTDVYSDSTHMNTKGYGIIAARAAALLVGEGPATPNLVTHGTRLSVRPTIDNVAYGPGSGIFNTGLGGGTPPEAAANNGGIYARLAASSIFYSFYTEQADLMVAIPHGIFAGATMTATLDFGIEQPHDVLNELNGLPIDYAARPANSWTYEATVTANMTGQARYERLIRIASPGWHTLKLDAQGAAEARVYALEFLSQREFQPPAVRYPLTLSTGSGVYTQTYGLMGAEVTLEGGVSLTSPTAGTWYTVATLPVGYRPKNFGYYPTAVTSFGGTVMAYARVQTTGEVQLCVSATTAAAIILNGIRFIPAHYI